ncbi:MAG TPA: tetratricopeptide repeat protein [Anaeromyxobacter sp.]|nr:tetratricopeptide repeat protein [Anaeromyxobacter sp.]
MARAALAILVVLPAAALAAAPRTGYVSCQVRGPRKAVARPSPAPPPTPSVPAGRVDAEREELIRAIERFEEEAKGYRAELQGEIVEAYKARRKSLSDHFERALDEAESLEKGDREAAVTRFQAFLERYPDDPSYTPETMFRLAELYYEEANEAFQAAVVAHAREARAALAEGREPPPPPVKSYAKSIALYQRIITGFPRYPFLHGIYYLLAYSLGEMNQGEEAQAAYTQLIRRFPQSPYVPEAWVRMGDWDFDAVEAGSLSRAAEEYRQVLAYPDHPLYPRALYKLGWTYYRLDDYPRSVDAFVRLLDHYVDESRKTGKKPEGEVWPEAVQYTAISLTDEAFGGVEKALAYFGALGGRPYEAEIYGRMGDVYFEETKYALAVKAYKAVLAVDPLSPEAPKIQAKIVLCWSRDRRFDEEAGAREVLVATYGEGTPWYEKNKGDPELITAVRDLSEKSLLRTASFHHAQAQQFKAEGRLEAAVTEYRVAAKAYGDYVSRFPHSKQAHELKYQWADCLYNALDFRRAAEVYAEVRDDPSSDAHLADAALSAIISWEGEVTRLERAGQLQERKVLRSADRKPDEVVRAEPLPEVLQNLVRDSDTFLDDVSEHERGPAIAYKAGELFYEYGDLDEARCRFEEVVDRWPSSPVAQYAANLIIESHLTQKDWAAVEASSERLQTAAVGKNLALNASLQKFKLGGRFNRAMQLMEAKQYEPAADLFLKLVAEDPHHEFADKALYNAASCYESARRFESALRLYERIYAEYPKSPLADEALFRVGFNAENTYDFDKAVGRYLLLVERYPKSKHRKDALFNAARSLENLQQYDEAAGTYVRYAKSYPEAEDAARTQFHAAVIYEKTSDWRKEIQALEEFVRRFSKTKEHELVVEAHLKIGLAYKELHQDAEARAAYTAAVREFAARGLKPEVATSAAAAAAEARFRLAEYDFERYDRITLPATTNTKKLKAALDAKLAEAKRVAPEYDEVMRYKRPDWILAAFYRKAYMLERLAQTLYDAPIPPEVKKNEEYLAAYQDALAQFAQPYEDQAVKVYIDALEAARRLHVKNEWTKKVSESLARYRPTEYPVLKEAKSALITDDSSPAAFADTPEGPTRRPLPGPAEPAPSAEPAPAPESPPPATTRADAPAAGREAKP